VYRCIVLFGRLFDNSSGGRTCAVFRRPAKCPHPLPLSQRERGGRIGRVAGGWWLSAAKPQAKGPGVGPGAPLRFAPATLPGIVAFAIAKFAKIGQQCFNTLWRNGLQRDNNRPNGPERAADVKRGAGDVNPSRAISYEQMGRHVAVGHVSRGRETMRFGPGTETALVNVTITSTTTCGTSCGKVERQLLSSGGRNGKKSCHMGTGEFHVRAYR